MHHHQAKGTYVTHTERPAKQPATATGPFATLRVSLRAGCTGAPSQLRRRTALFLAAASLLALAAAPSAAADGRIGGDNTFPGSFQAGGFGGEVEGLAVSEQQGGDLYALNRGSIQRVNQFQPDGTFVRAFGWGVAPGAGSGTADLEAGSTAAISVSTTSGAFEPGQHLNSGSGIAPGTYIVSVNSNELILSQPATENHPGAALTATAAPGNVPTDELQRLTVSATAGEFKLTFASLNPGSTTATTPALAYNASAAQVQSALEALANIGSGNVSVSGGPGDEKGTSPYLIEFHGRYADVNVHRLSVAPLGLSGGSPASAATTATIREGGATLETCTAVCWGEPVEQSPAEAAPGEGALPGQLDSSSIIAVDNSCSQREPPLSGAACEAFDPSYGDVYVGSGSGFRIQKFSPSGEFLLMFGGGVDKTKVAEREAQEANSEPVTVTAEEEDVCTKSDLVAGDTCGAGVPGTGPSHFYRGGVGRDSWGGERNHSIAVGPDGTVYVGDYDRVQEFDPDGAFSGQLTLSDPEPQFVTALAVDAAGDVFERSARYGTTNGVFGQVSQVPGVREYGPSHAFLRTLDAEEATSQPTDIALDAAGDLLVADPNGLLSPAQTGAFSFRAFRPGGALYAVFNSDQAHVTATEPLNGIAFGAALDKLYAVASSPEGLHIAVISTPQPGSPLVEAEHVTDLEPETATLHALVNPKQFDTKYRFQYITDAAFKADGNSFGAGTQLITPAEPDLGSVDRQDPVQAALSALTPRTLYHWRVVAESHCNEAIPSEVCEAKPEATFETLPDVSVRNFTTQTVGPELVKLRAELSPDNGTGTEYTLRYGTDAPAYQCEPGHTCSTHGTVNVLGNDFEPISATFTELKPNTTYHYQLLLKNSYGEEHTADQTFTTELSAAEERQAEDCPNTTLREENSSLALPDCRAYEQVSPPYKAGFNVGHLEHLAPSGERVLYGSLGAFAGAVEDNPPLITQYLARRTGAGWITQAVTGRPAGPGYEPSPAYDFSPELDRWVFPEYPGLSLASRVHVTSGTLYMGSAGAGFLQASPTIHVLEIKGQNPSHFMQPAAQSDDLSTLFIATAARLLPAPEDERPSENAEGLEGVHPSRIYRISGVGGPNPTLQLYAEVPLGLGGQHNADTCRIDAPYGSARPGLRPNLADPASAGLASSDGSTLFYTDPIEKVSGAACGPGTPNPIGLFARTGLAAPVQLNLPPPSQCHSPSPCASSALAVPALDGISPDGSLAWFETPQSLIDSDADATYDLYLAKLEGGALTELVQASAGDPAPGHPTPGAGAGVLGPLAISTQGSTAAFVATGVLTTQPNSAGSTASLHEAAAEGADNLYAYDATSAETKFIARLCSGPEESGSVKDPSCPSSQGRNDAELWNREAFSGSPEAHLTPDGRHLVFTSFARLTPDDTDDVKDVYRYDLQAGRLIRLSFGHRGNDANGNDDLFPDNIGTQGTGNGDTAEELAEDPSRSISADGAVVVFRTAAPLVSRDTNTGSNPGCRGGEVGKAETGCDLYEWSEDGHGTCHESGGCVSLVSDGLDPHGVFGGVISASGRDITFNFSRGLVPADTDGVGDVYDAREGGGFPYAPPPIPCGGNESCHESAPPPPAPPQITTGGDTGGNGLTKLECGKGRHSVKKHGEIRCVANTHKKTHKAKKHHKRAEVGRGGNR